MKRRYARHVVYVVLCTDVLSNRCLCTICTHRCHLGVWLQVRVNWAFQKDQREDTSGHHNIFVGDLSSDITDIALFDAFQHCEQCSDAHVMVDHATNR